MCRLAQCNDCGRPTYAGCGNHVEAVLGHVPVEKRCSCAADAPERRSWFSGLSRRRARQ